MRKRGRLGLLAAATLTLVAGLLPPSTAASAAPASRAPQLEAQRARLVQQLAALEGPRAGARRDLLDAEHALVVTERRLVASRRSITTLNARLLDLSRHIADDEHVLLSARRELAALVRATYEMTGEDGFATAILSSDSFNQAVDRVRGAQQVTEQVKRLQRTVEARESSLLLERSELREQFARAQQVELQLGHDANRMLALVAERDGAVQDLDGPARELAKRIADIDQQLAGPPPSLHGGCGNHFAFGQCTWYVATRRCIPWFGNAWEWWRNAALLGFPEGHEPRVGAVAVWGRRGHGVSRVGHVAYVEAVGPTDGVPAGSFKVSEMNHDGWDRIDYRVVDDGAVIGFIYSAL